MTKELKWYEYSQNNSGGFLLEPAENLYVQAYTAKEADEVAESFGVYEDWEFESDCDCCGVRWTFNAPYEFVTPLNDAEVEYKLQRYSKYASSKTCPIWMKVYADGTVKTSNDEKVEECKTK
jgi:hypothetical protein